VRGPPTYWQEKYESSNMISFLANVCLWIRPSILPHWKGTIHTISDVACGQGPTFQRTSWAFLMKKKVFSPAAADKKLHALKLFIKLNK
jgi:hypothetical protein